MAVSSGFMIFSCQIVAFTGSGPRTPALSAQPQQGSFKWLTDVLHAGNRELRPIFSPQVALLSSNYKRY